MRASVSFGICFMADRVLSIEGEDAEMHQDKDVMPTVTIQEETAEELEPEVVPVVPESEVLEESFWF